MSGNVEPGVCGEVGPETMIINTDTVVTISIHLLLNYILNHIITCGGSTRVVLETVLKPWRWTVQTKLFKLLLQIVLLMMVMLLLLLSLEGLWCVERTDRRGAAGVIVRTAASVDDHSRLLLDSVQVILLQETLQQSRRRLHILSL